MIQSARQRRKKRQDLMGTIGIIALVVIFGGGFYFFQSTSDPLDKNYCSINNGPNAVTAIIFDKSQMYTNDQVTDIKTSFNLWLAGEEAITKNRNIDLDFFQEGNLIQLYVADEKALSQPDGLEPVEELCEKAEGNSPIMETLIRISNSESFQKHPNVNHNIFIVSDMIQNSNNWTHYSGRNQGANWSRFSSEMSGTVFMRPRLNQVQVQVFYAKRQNQRDKSIQTRSHVQFWEEFFFNANANVSGWINIDG